MFVQFCWITFCLLSHFCASWVERCLKFNRGEILLQLRQFFSASQQKSSNLRFCFNLQFTMFVFCIPNGLLCTTPMNSKNQAISRSLTGVSSKLMLVQFFCPHLGNGHLVWSGLALEYFNVAARLIFPI